MYTQVTNSSTNTTDIQSPRPNLTVAAILQHLRKKMVWYGPNAGDRNAPVFTVCTRDGSEVNLYQLRPNIWEVMHDAFDSVVIINEAELEGVLAVWVNVDDLEDRSHVIANVLKSVPCTIAAALAVCTEHRLTVHQHGADFIDLEGLEIYLGAGKDGFAFYTRQSNSPHQSHIHHNLAQLNTALPHKRPRQFFADETPTADVYEQAHSQLAI